MHGDVAGRAKRGRAKTSSRPCRPLLTCRRTADQDWTLGGSCWTAGCWVGQNETCAKGTVFVFWNVPINCSHATKQLHFPTVMILLSPLPITHGRHPGTFRHTVWVYLTLAKENSLYMYGAHFIDIQHTTNDMLVSQFACRFSLK